MNTLFNTQPFLFLLVAAIAVSAQSVYASPPQEPQSKFEAIDDYIKTEMKRLRIPGMALGIVHGNDIVHLQGYGVADSSGHEITPQTPFQIGSVTKSFTALAVMQLVEAGKVELDAPVQTYLRGSPSRTRKLPRKLQFVTCSTRPAAFRKRMAIAFGTAKRTPKKP